MLLNESFVHGGKLVSPLYYLGYIQDMKIMEKYFLKETCNLQHFFLFQKAKQIVQAAK